MFIVDYIQTRINAIDPTNEKQAYLSRTLDLPISNGYVAPAPPLLENIVRDTRLGDESEEQGIGENM